jgi:methylated-DNA-[protein]-cysteine S-methyltransferase
MRGETLPMAAADAGIFARESSYLDCYVQIGVAGEKVISLSTPDHSDEPGDHPLLDRIEAYLEGDVDDLRDVDVGLTAPTPHREVLEATREIPPREQATVEQLTGMTPGLDPSNGEDQTAVRQALADNPVPLVIPDHRVRDGPSALPPGIEQKLRSLEDL